MKENLRPFGYLDEYIDMLDVSAETKGEIRDKLIDNIQKNNKIQLEQERLKGYKEGEKWAKLERQQKKRIMLGCMLCSIKLLLTAIKIQSIYLVEL